MDLPSLLGIGGPSATVGAVAAFMLRAYRARKKEARDDRAADRADLKARREDDRAGIEAMKEVVNSLRGELAEVRAENAEFRAMIDRLHEDNAQLRDEIHSLRVELAANQSTTPGGIPQ